MKIKLIAPARKTEWGKSFWDLRTLCELTGKKAGCVPLALPTLAALAPPDVDITIVDENIEPVDFDEEVDLVAISFFTSLAPRAYEIAREFHKRNICVVLGGIHASMLPDEAILHADSVVIGEAEVTWPQLLEDFSKGNLRKFYRASDFPSLEKTPLPRWDLVKAGYYSYFTLQTGRGCPNNCSFCSVTALNGHKYRHKSIENILSEVRLLQQIDPRKTIFFTDDNILAAPSYAKQLFKALIPLNCRWWCQASLDKLRDDDLLELMYQSGCREIFVGFESVSQKSLILMNKSRINKAEEYKNTVERVHAHGIAVFGSFVLGSDTDDQNIFEETEKFIDESNIAFSMINILTPLPGTVLYRTKKNEQRLLCDDWSRYDGESTCFEPRLLSREELSKGRQQVLEKTYSYESLYKRLQKLWSSGVFVRNRKGGGPLFTKGRLLFSAKSFFYGDIKRTQFVLRGLWDSKVTSTMVVAMALNFHDYANFMRDNDS